MAQKALFISVNDLKKKSIIDGMVDEDKIIQFIEVAQDTHIQRYLGTDLYEKLQADVIAGSLTGNYLILVDTYIKPMLIWYTQATYIPFSTIQIGNGGAFRRVPENAESVSKSDLDALIFKANETADFYTKRYLDYICNNSTLFPEYSTNTSGDIFPDKDSTYSNWVI